MKAISSILLCTAFALAAAKPWYSNSYESRASHQKTGYFDSQGYYHHAAETAMTHETISAAKTQQQSGLGICQSARYGSGIAGTYFHVCESGVSDSGNKEYCFITNGPCCIISSSATTPVGHYLLTLDQLTVNVKYYGSSGAQGVCYTLDKDKSELGVCGGCQAPSCVETRCIENTATGDLSSCDENGCRCREGFAPPDCCECDFSGLSGRPHYKDPVTGECKPFCDMCMRRTPTGCAQCQEGYTGPGCCICDKGYYKSEDGTCRRPRCERSVVSCTDGVCTCEPGYLPQDCCECDSGYYEAPDGTCKRPECDRRVISCTNGECTCVPGYLPDDCCECDPGYYKAPDGTCKRSECQLNVVSCTNGVCTCEPGYLPQDCCECDSGYYKAPDGTCKKPKCEKNSRFCENGLCTCKPGYLPQDCCECDPGYYKAPDGTCKTSECPDKVVQCINGACSCQKGYAPKDCCLCDKDFYYNPIDKTCKEPCTNNIVSCTEGKCTCKPSYSGIDCCKRACIPQQDIFFVIDATLSNNRDTFCETHYGTELLLHALNSGNSLSGTRVEMVVLPNVASRTQDQKASTLFGLGTGCTEAVGKALNLVDAFYSHRTNDVRPWSPYLYQVQSRLTYPAPAIESVRKTIEDGIAVGEPRNRQRVVIIVTDGENDELATDKPGTLKTYDEVDRLRAINSDNPSLMTVIVAGNNDSRSVKDQARFKAQLERIAGDPNNVVRSSKPRVLAEGIVKRMAAVGAICDNQEKEILDELSNSNGVSAQCNCIEGRSTSISNTRSEYIEACNTACPKANKNECRIPSAIRCSGTTSENPWYVGSNNYEPYTFPATIQGNLKKSELEQEILQAVEEVLQERMNVN